MNTLTSLIVAKANNGTIGKDGQLPWHLPADLKRFRDLTLYKPVIMGRKTWESLPEHVKPLKDRFNIIISSTLPPGQDSHGVMIVPTYSEALKAAHAYYRIVDGRLVAQSQSHAYKLAEQDDECEIMVIGGASLYQFVYDYGLVDRMYITEVADDYEGDTFFNPDVHNGEWERSVKSVSFTDRASYVVYDRVGHRPSACRDLD